MKQFITRVCEWNQTRYPRVIDIDLAKRLLEEEVNEAVEALINLEGIYAEPDRPKEAWNKEYEKRKAHLVKELFDTCFVSIGVLWKLGFNPGDIEQLFSLCCDSNDSKPTRKLDPADKGVKGNDFVPAEPKLLRYFQYMNEARSK